MQIVDRMATSPFSREIKTVPRRDRGASYGGRSLGNRADSLTFHLTKRVAIEQQWVDGTTAGQYVADLRRAVRAPHARLAVYASGPDCVAVTVAPTRQALPPERRGAQPESLLLVVYSANRGILTTGYQISSVEATSIPLEARWLR